MNCPKCGTEMMKNKKIKRKEGYWDPETKEWKVKEVDADALYLGTKYKCRNCGFRKF